MPGWESVKQTQIDDLHLHFNMMFDIINLVFNKMEETFQYNKLVWSSLVLYIYWKKKETHIHFECYLYQICIVCVNESVFEMLNIHI